MGKIAITRCDWCRASSPCGSDNKAGSGDVAGSSDVAGSGDVAVPLRQHSVFDALLLQQCSVFAAFKAYL